MKQKIRSFKDLKVWHLARQIKIIFFERVKKFLSIERYRFSDQMIRSSRSVTDQIAEGYGCYHYQKNIQYSRQDRGSAYELKNQFITALDCSYISDEEFHKFSDVISRCMQMLNGYINYLKKAKKEYGNILREDEVPYIEFRNE